MAVTAAGEPTIIHRPMVRFLVAVLSVFELVAGVELVFWAPFRSSVVFQPARAVTASWSEDLHLHSLDLWGFACVATGLLLPAIFSRRWWSAGWAGAILGTFVTIFLAYTFLEEVETPALLAPPPPQQHSGLFVATFVSLAAVIFAGIVVATWREHSHRRARAKKDL